MMNTHNFLTASTIVLFSLAFVACTGNGVTNNNDDNCLKVTEVDAPDNLVTYFDSLLRYTQAFIYTRNVDDIHPNPDSLAVIESIRVLDEYLAHSRAEYPREIVGNALGHLIFTQWHYDTHGDDDEDMMVKIEHDGNIYWDWTGQIMDD